MTRLNPHLTFCWAALVAIGCASDARNASGAKSTPTAAHSPAHDDKDEAEDLEMSQNDAPARLPQESRQESAGYERGVDLNFEDADVGGLPKGWTVAETNGSGTPATWRVAETDCAPSGRHVLRLESKNPSGTFNLLLSDKELPADIDVEVKIHADSGSEDQGGGLVWRARDANNYYVARWNPLEKNLRLYKVVDGKRTMFKSVTVDPDPKAWHTLEAKMTGKKIDIELDGKTLLTHEDDSFTGGGKVGLWSKADASSSFDNLEVSWPRTK
jgi:hypothetical protein